MLNGNDTSIIQRFRYNQVSMLAGNDVIALSPVGVALYSLWIVHADFERVTATLYWCSIVTIRHRFRYNQVLQLAGNDVIVLSPRGGAASDFQIRILKVRP